MSAQEELEKLEREMRGTLCHVEPDRVVSEWADRLAAIQEDFGKAQGEPVAWVCISNDGKTRSLWWRKDQALDRNAGHEFEPLYATPPADSAQTEKPFKAPGKWFPIDLLGNPMVECEPGRWRSMVSADSAQGLVEALEEVSRKLSRDYLRGRFIYPSDQKILEEVREELANALAAHKSEVKG